MNPYGIGPGGAIFLTVFVTVAVLVGINIVGETTVEVTKLICNTVLSVWFRLENIVREVVGKKSP